MPGDSARTDWFMLWTCPRTTIELALEICFVYFATRSAIRLETEPRSVPWTPAYTSNTGWTLQRLSDSGVVVRWKSARLRISWGGDLPAMSTGARWRSSGEATPDFGVDAT